MKGLSLFFKVLPTLSSLERRHKWITSENSLGNFDMRNDEVFIWFINASQENLKTHRSTSESLHRKWLLIVLRKGKKMLYKNNELRGKGPRF